MCPLSREINFLSEGVRCGLDKEIAPDGTYLTYFPLVALIEAAQMLPSDKKFHVIRGHLRPLNHCPKWDVRQVLPIWGNFFIEATSNPF